jgi:glycosyltransferase involved in cell wall biosynthesis
MKILMIAPQPYFEPRGTPISVHQRLWALSKLGHELDLLTYHVGETPDIPNVRILRNPRIPFIKEVKIGPSWEKLILDPLLFLYAVWLLLTNEYDVIHSHEEAAFLTMPLAFIFRRYHLYDMHSSLPNQLKNFKFGNRHFFIKLFSILEQWVFKTCHAVITIDTDLAAHVAEINPFVPQATIENLAVFEESVSTGMPAFFDTTHFPVNHPIIAYTGTFETYQGLEHLLLSIQIMRETLDKFMFLLVGGKPAQVAKLRAFAHRHGVAESVYFAGILPPQQAIAVLKHAHILISPRTEGTAVPLKIYSYLHAGKPIIATDIAAHTQVLDANTALLVQPTPAAIANGIIHLLQNPDLQQKLGINAKKLADTKYNPTSYLNKVRYIYGHVTPMPVRKMYAVKTTRYERGA